MYVYFSSVRVGCESLDKSPLKDVVNALHDEAEFADADWELLGMQLNVSQAKLDNIRWEMYTDSYVLWLRYEGAVW